MNPTLLCEDGSVCLEQSEWRKIALQKTVSNLKFGWQGFINPMSSQFLKRVLFVICVVHIWLSFCVKKRRVLGLSIDRSLVFFQQSGPNGVSFLSRYSLGSEYLVLTENLKNV